MHKTAYYGNQFLGLFYKANNELALVPVDAQDKNIDAVRDALGVECVQTSIAGSNLIGLYTAMNSNGVILPNVTDEKEVAKLKQSGLNVYVSAELNNAHGNNLCVNDKGGIINPRVDSAEKKSMEDVLGVEIVAMSIAKYPTVGSACLCNNKGFLVHYSADENEMEQVKTALGVPGAKATLNMGVGFLGACAVCNDKGIVIGENSSGFEAGKAEAELGYL